MIWIEEAESPSFEKIIRHRRTEVFDDEICDFVPYTIPFLDNIRDKAKTIQQTLRTQLQLVGLDQGWLLAQGSSLHGQAIYSLTANIDKASIPQLLKDHAQEELSLLADCLVSIFSRKIKLYFQEEPNGIYCFHGYSNKLEADATKRIIISQRLEDYIHPKTERTIHPDTQIEIKTITGITPRGRAVAGSDSSLRIGFRCPEFDPPRWIISIDSVESSPFARYDHPRVQRINPLSNAIKAGRLDGNIFSPTFHYSDTSAISRPEDPEKTIAGFNTLNEKLYQVFRNLSRN